MGQDDVTEEQQAAIKRSAERRMKYLRGLVAELERADREGKRPMSAEDQLAYEAACAIRQLAGIEP